MICRPLLVLVVLLVAGHGPAWGYVNYKTTTGKPFYWPESCVPLTAYTDNFTELPRDQVRGALVAATTAWSAPGRACTYMDILLDFTGGVGPGARYDARNTLTFVTSDWCQWDDVDKRCRRDPMALAITSLFAKADGHITDVDIAVNAAKDVVFWMNADDKIVAGAHDIQNTMTHEVGHFLGFDHTCHAPGDMERNIDHLGAPVPDCPTASPIVKATTMFAETLAGDQDKRSLEADDQQALCDNYPPALDPKLCSAGMAPDSCGCSTPAGPPRVGVGLLSAALALMVARGRRRHRRPATTGSGRRRGPGRSTTLQLDANVPH